MRDRHGLPRRGAAARNRGGWSRLVSCRPVERRRANLPRRQDRDHAANGPEGASPNKVCGTRPEPSPPQGLPRLGAAIAVGAGGRSPWSLHPRTTRGRRGRQDEAGQPQHNHGRRRRQRKCPHAGPFLAMTRRRRGGWTRVAGL